MEVELVTIRRAIGVVLVIAAGVLALLIARGGPILPHILGPVVLAIVGVLHLTGRARPQSRLKGG